MGTSPVDPSCFATVYYRNEGGALAGVKIGRDLLERVIHGISAQGQSLVHIGLGDDDIPSVLATLRAGGRAGAVPSAPSLQAVPAARVSLPTTQPMAIAQSVRATHRIPTMGWIAIGAAALGFGIWALLRGSSGDH